MKKNNKEMISYLNKFKNVNVLVLGDIMHDVFIWGNVKRISPEAPVPIVEVTRETSLLGGAANVVNNVLALGARASMAGVVGKDRTGEAVVKELDRIGANRDCVHKSMTRPTAVKTRVIAQKQQVVRFDKEEIRPLKTSTEKKLWRSLKNKMDDVDAVILSDYAKGLLSEKLTKNIIGLCNESGKTVAVDPKPVNMDWYKNASIITPNSKEAGEAAGFEIVTDDDVERAGQLLIEKLGCKYILITRGEQGMSLFSQDKKTIKIRALAREVFDVTGAGDTVIGVLATAMASGMEISDAMKAANVAAGIVVGKVGTSVATVEEIKNAVKDLKL
jgi:D-glycero-beta-D-manno-heptose-7-phosphate kinase